LPASKAHLPAQHGVYMGHPRGKSLSPADLQQSKSSLRGRRDNNRRNVYRMDARGQRGRTAWTARAPACYCVYDSQHQSNYQSAISADDDGNDRVKKSRASGNFGGCVRGVTRNLFTLSMS